MYDERNRMSTFRAWTWELIGATVVLVSRFVFAPRTPWLLEEFHFLRAIHILDLHDGDPPPLGYPLYVALGKLGHFLFAEPFAVLIVLSAMACAIGFLAVAGFVRDLSGDRLAGVVAASVLFFSPEILAYTPMATDDAVLMALVAGAFLFALRAASHDSAAITAGVLFAATIGCRPQMTIAIVPAFIAVLFTARSSRWRVVATVAFVAGLGCVVVALSELAGGMHALASYIRMDHPWFVGGSPERMTASQWIARTLFHPWGPKLIAAPIAVAAMAGAWFARSKIRELLPLFTLAIVLALYAKVGIPSEDAPRYAIPFLLLTATLVAIAVVRLPRAMVAVPVGLFVAAALWYVHPVLRARSRSASPVVQAVRALQTDSQRPILLWDARLRPVVDVLLSRTEHRKLGRGWQELALRTDVPLIRLALGRAEDDDARYFAWPPSDAFRKLTRGTEGEATLDPLRVDERFGLESGVLAAESTVLGDSWRWLAPRAELLLPAAKGSAAHLLLRLPSQAPFDDVAVTLHPENAAPVTVTIGKKAQEVVVPVRDGLTARIRIESNREFRSADGLTRSVQLLGVERR